MSAIRSETATSTFRRFTRAISSCAFPKSYPPRATGPSASSNSTQFRRSPSTTCFGGKLRYGFPYVASITRVVHRSGTALPHVTPPSEFMSPV